MGFTLAMGCSLVPTRPRHLDFWRGDIFHRWSPAPPAPVLSSPLRLVHHAEDVALGVLEEDEIPARLRSAGMDGRSKVAQPSHLLVLLVGVEIEMQTVLSGALLRNELQGDVDMLSVGVPEHHEVPVRRV